MDKAYRFSLPKWAMHARETQGTTRFLRVILPRATVSSVGMGQEAAQHHLWCVCMHVTSVQLPRSIRSGISVFYPGGIIRFQNHNFLLPSLRLTTRLVCVCWRKWRNQRIKSTPAMCVHQHVCIYNRSHRVTIAITIFKHIPSISREFERASIARAPSDMDRFITQTEGRRDRKHIPSVSREFAGASAARASPGMERSIAKSEVRWDRFVETGKGEMVQDPLTTETGGKMEHDLLMYSPRSAARATATGIPIGDQGVAVLRGPLIVGAGPAGLACAAMLTMGLVPYVILERDMCIASTWHRRTYDRLCLHLPKRYCQLPLMPFPHSYPTYPVRQQFLAYLDEYKRKHGIRPFFNMEVVSAEYDGEYWCVRTKDTSDNVGGSMLSSCTMEYRSKWLIVATGENAEPVVPEIKGMRSFKGEVIHSSDYRNGEEFQGKKVLVIGCGNSGMEVSLDLANYNVHTSMVVRDSVRNLCIFIIRWIIVTSVIYIYSPQKSVIIHPLSLYIIYCFSWLKFMKYRFNSLLWSL